MRHLQHSCPSFQPPVPPFGGKKKARGWELKNTQITPQQNPSVKAPSPATDQKYSPALNQSPPTSVQPLDSLENHLPPQQSRPFEEPQLGKKREIWLCLQHCWHRVRNSFMN